MKVTLRAWREDDASRLYIDASNDSAVSPGKPAKQAKISYDFSALTSARSPRVRRLELGYRTNNPASAAVARHTGFVVEGVEREKFCYNGVLYDAAIAARLHRDVNHMLAATSSSGASAAL